MKHPTLLLLAAATLAGQSTDAFGYTLTGGAPYSYADIGSTGVSILAGIDDDPVTLALPFGFRFYGVTYSEACVSPNGLIAFGGCVANDFTNLDLTAQIPAGDRPLIAAHWADLTFARLGAGSLFYQTLGVAPNRRFVIQWQNAIPTDGDGAFNFQALLFEGSGAITLQYRNLQSGAPGWSNGGRATIGIRNSGAPANLHRLQWSYNAPALSDNFAINFTAPVALAPVELTSSFRITTSSFLLNRITRTYNGTVTLTNTSSQAINPPLTLVLSNLTAGVTALGVAGAQAGLGPLYSVPGAAILSPGATVTVPVSFNNPANAVIQFTPRLFSGSF